MKRVIKSSINSKMYRGYEIVKNSNGYYDVFFRDDVAETGFKEIDNAKNWIDMKSGDVTMYRGCKIKRAAEGYVIDDPNHNVITSYAFETLKDAKQEIDDQLEVDW